VRRRLAILVLATTSLVVVAFLAPLAVLIREIAVQRGVTAGAHDAQSVAAFTGVLPDPAQLQAIVNEVNQQALQTSVLLPDGSTVGPPLAPSPSLTLAQSGRAFTAAIPQGREILLPVETRGGRAVVRTLVPASVLTAGVPRALAVLAGLGAALIGLAVAVADRLARWTLRPVAALAGTARRLAHGELTARVEPAGPPELVEVCAALNLLADRIGELLGQERETAADLSHRLRTPLTALRLEAHALADPAESARMVNLVAGLERTVNGIISAARRPVREGVAAACDAAPVVAGRAGYWAPLAEDQGRQVTLRVPSGPLWVRLAAGDLAAVVDALLENVFAHTPEGTDFLVVLVARPGGGARLVVADSGPGLPGGPVAGRGVSRGGSTGLGLDIVRRAAQASGGSLLLSRGGGGRGARVEVQLGPPAGQSAAPDRRPLGRAGAWPARAAADGGPGRYTSRGGGR
jgi:signal transduction histidine kinase